MIVSDVNENTLKEMDLLVEEGAHHGRSGNPDTQFVPDEIVDRFCLIGPVEKHIEKLTALRALGVDQFALYDMHDAQEAVIDTYGTKVIPAVNA
ncbi:hypothetical protein SVIOM342S_10377 [Streptomyces violaceorubidus]